MEHDEITVRKLYKMMMQLQKFTLSMRRLTRFPLQVIRRTDACSGRDASSHSSTIQVTPVAIVLAARLFMENSVGLRRDPVDAGGQLENRVKGEERSRTSKFDSEKRCLKTTDSEGQHCTFLYSVLQFLK